jgi:hypothetical protein
MKFPLAILDIDNYNRKIRQLIEDKECIIFLDTNIFARYYSLHSSARNEFASWCRAMIVDGRIKVPVWVLHEYSNRFVRDQTHDYFSPIKKLNTMVKEFVQIKDFLTMSTPISDTTLLEQLNELDRNLTELNNKVQPNKPDHVAIHVELENLFKSSILKSNIEDLVQRANNCGQSRFSHKMPPGFIDSAQKELNTLGDLIIWYEILEYSRENDSKKVIFLTNDNKKDWMYAPLKIKENARTIPNKSNFKVADPRLIHEFYLATESDEFYIIDFKTLTDILISSGTRSYMNMAAALQLNYEEQEEVHVQNEPMMGDFEMEAEEEIPNVQSEIEVSSQELPLQDPIQNMNDLIDLGSFSRSDIGEFISDNSPISMIIDELKEYDWYGQNASITKLSQIILVELPHSKKNRDLLFYLGISIYESACGGAWKAVEYMRRLQFELDLLDDFTATFILSGMLHEMYFNSRNIFRYDDLKSTFSEELLFFQNDEKVKYAIEFISELLQPYEENILMIPSAEPEQIEISILYTVFNNSNPLIENTYVIEDIQSQGKNLLYAEDSRWSRNTLSCYKEEMEKNLSLFFAVPQNLLTILYSPEEPEPNSYFYLENTKSLGINGSVSNDEDEFVAF